MIYISSSCVKFDKIKDSIQLLVDNGYKNIELSGGTHYYDGFEDDLLELKNKYNLNYICHNYFPPPKEHFVLNLASSNDEIYNKSIEHIITAIELSKKLGSNKFAFHAGFLIDIPTTEIGKKIKYTNTFDKELSFNRFIDAFNILSKEANDIKLYIENNVYSKTNYSVFGDNNPFMLSTLQDYIELKKNIEFNLLLDIAHLKVSTNTLKLDFKSQLKELIKVSNYIHISENDSFHDLNKSLYYSSDIINEIKQYPLKNKHFTIEIYDQLENIDNSYKLLRKTIDDSKISM